jgi:hypothetical protein
VEHDEESARHHVGGAGLHGAGRFGVRRGQGHEAARYRRIPVLRDGTPVGVVFIGDLALEKDATSVLSGVSSAPPNS